MLPDSLTDPIGSKGYFIFSIKRLNSVPGTTINNTASIYFDFNPPIITNTTSNTYYDKVNLPNNAQSTINKLCNQTCGDGSITVSPIGGVLPYSISVNPSCATTTISGTTINNLKGGNYLVTVTDALGQVSTLNKTVNDAPAPGVSLAATLPTGPNTGIINATVTGGTAPFTYQWTGANCSGPNCTGLNFGTYSVVVTDAGGCQTTSIITLAVPEGIDDKDLTQWQVYPNPTNQEIIIKVDKTIGNVVLLSPIGQVVMNKYVGTDNVRIDVSELANGVYLLKLEGKIVRITIQH
jgi:hypothetical protein